MSRQQENEEARRKIFEARVNDPRYLGICKSCWGAGWQIIKKLDPVWGVPNRYVKPCECDSGRKYDKSYAKAALS